MRKDDEANDNNEPIIWLSVCISFFPFLVLLCLLSLSLSVSFALIKHIEEKVDEGKGRWIFFSPYKYVCVRWTVHHRCVARSRSSLTSVVDSYRWVTVLPLSFHLPACLPTHALVQISHLTIFFYSNVCIVCARA